MAMRGTSTPRLRDIPTCTYTWHQPDEPPTFTFTLGWCQAWPVADGAAVVLEETTVVIQVQGKKRGTVEVPTATLEDRDAVERIALEAQLLEKYAKGEADAPSPESLVIL